MVLYANAYKISIFFLDPYDMLKTHLLKYLLTLPLDAFWKIRNQHGSKMDSFIWTLLLTFLISIRVPQSTMLFKKWPFLFSSSHTILHLINNYVPQSLYDLRFLIWHFSVSPPTIPFSPLANSVWTDEIGYRNIVLQCKSDPVIS